VSQLAYLLKKMQETHDGDGSLLDHSLILYGSGISDGNKHNHDNLPVLLAGGSRAFRTGRHVRLETSTPITNLYVSMLETMGVPTDRFGDSEGRLNHLTDLT